MEIGVIAKWHAKEGELIAQGTLLCSIETDKTTVDYESLDDGYLRKILIEEGGKAQVNQLIAFLTDSADEDYLEELSEVHKKNKEEMAAKSTVNNAPATAQDLEHQAPIPNVAAPFVAPGFTQTVPMSNPLSGDEELPGGIRVTPVARKIAEERGINLTWVKGSGPRGRIIKADIENYNPAQAQSSTLPAGQVSTPIQKPTGNEPAGYGSLAPVLPDQDTPLSLMRKTIGDRLLQSHLGAPAFFVTNKFAMDKLLALRADLNQTPGYKISLNDLMIKATAAALRQVPECNSSFHGTFIRRHANIDISVAVSIPDGLITPILRNADQKPLGQISAEMKSLGQKAKTGGLSPEEFQGGTFTISNLGMTGVTGFTSIINPPQACILAIAGIQDELFRNEQGEIADRKVMSCTLTSDHRVVDGIVAANFMNALKAIIENPASLML
jgi:pyruvate dehydrogenase E2 component (dihydrolipoamide acetyltransferase)